METKWTLAQGIRRLLSEANDPEGIDDLVIEGRQMTLDVSLAKGLQTTDEDGKPLVEPREGISVILTCCLPAKTEEEEDYWMFNLMFFPEEGETYAALLRRIALGLGIGEDEPVWEGP